MAATTCETEFAALKLLREAQREKSLLKNRQDYQRQRAHREVRKAGQKDCKHMALSSYRLARPHRSARSVTRSWLARGEVSGETDMPTVSIGYKCWHKLAAPHKPSAPHLRDRSEAPYEMSCEKTLWFDEDYSDADTSAPEFSVEEFISAASSPELSFADAAEIPKEISVQETELESLPPPVLGDSEDSEMNLSARVDQERLDQSSRVEASKRETILKKVAAKLQQRAREAEREAEEAKARALQVELNAASQNAKVETTKVETAATLKLAKVMDQQRARRVHKQAEQQRRKEQEHRAELEAIKLQAQEQAVAIREQALSEIVAMKAKAKADVRAARIRSVAAAKAEAEAKASAEAEVLRSEAERLAETAKAEAAALRAEAEQEAESTKAKAAHEAKALLSEATAERAQSSSFQGVEDRPDVATRRETILQGVVTKLRQQAREAEQHAEDATARSLELERTVAAQQQKEGAAATLKLAKTMDQQRARKIHKQAEQDRRKDELQRNVVETARAQAEEEKRVIKGQALLEAAALKAKAKAEAKAARSRVIAAAKAEAQERALAEAMSLRAQAERAAEAIKAKATAEAQELPSQAEAEQAQNQSLEMPAVAVEENAGLEMPAVAVKEEAELSTAEYGALASSTIHFEEEWHLLSGSEAEDGEWDILG